MSQLIHLSKHYLYNTNKLNCHPLLMSTLAPLGLKYFKKVKKPLKLKIWKKVKILRKLKHKTKSRIQNKSRRRKTPTTQKFTYLQRKRWYEMKQKRRKKLRRWKRSWLVWFRNHEMAKRAKKYSLKSWWTRIRTRRDWWKRLRKLRKKKYYVRHFFMWRYKKNSHTVRMRSLSNFYYRRLWLLTYGPLLKRRFLKKLIEITWKRNKKMAMTNNFLPYYTLGAFVCAAFHISSRSFKYRFQKKMIFLNGRRVITPNILLSTGDIVHVAPTNFYDLFKFRRVLRNKLKFQTNLKMRYAQIWKFSRLSRFSSRRKYVLETIKHSNSFFKKNRYLNLLRRKHVWLGVLKKNQRKLNNSLIILRRSLLASFYKPLLRHETMRISCNSNKISRHDWWQTRMPFIYRSSTHWNKRLLERVITY